MAISRYDFFLSASGLSGGALPDLELFALKGAGVTSDNLNEAWFQFLTLQGQTSGTLNDRMYKWLGSKGYEGSLDDRLYQMYQNESSLSAPALVALALTVGTNSTFYGYINGQYGSLTPTDAGGGNTIVGFICIPGDRIFFNTQTTIDSINTVRYEFTANGTDFEVEGTWNGGEYVTSSAQAVAGTFDALVAELGNTIDVNVFEA